MMTSRNEYRLLLRQDNADMRLTEKGFGEGLISSKRYKVFVEKRNFIKNELERLKNKVYKPSEINPLLKSIGQNTVASGISADSVLKRPGIHYDMLRETDDDIPVGNRATDEAIEVECKYEGYIQKQLQLVERFEKNESKPLRQDMDYSSISGLRLEARQKLDEIKPSSVGQASRISGVSPSDINVLLIYMEQEKRRKDE